MHYLNSKKSREQEGREIARTVALAFLTVCGLGTILADALVYRFTKNPAVIARLETGKGWAFIVLTTVLIFVVTKLSVARFARAEETCRAVLNSIADGVLILGRGRSIVAANPAAAKMLGQTSGDDLVGMGPEEFVRRFHVTLPNGSQVQPGQLVSQRALTGEVPPPYKALLYPPGHSELVIRSTAAPVRPNSDGPVELAVSVMHDITQQENLDRMRNQFFSAAAHALKTPITIIKASVDARVARESSQDRQSPEHRCAVIVGRQCGKISRLTDNILALARLRSGTLELHPEVVDCAEVVDQVMREMRGASAEHGVVCRIDARPKVFGDRERLVMALRNLTEVALRNGLPQTDVVIALDETGTRARFEVSHQAAWNECSEEADDEMDADMYSGLGLERHLAEAIVVATNGTFRSERARDPGAVSVDRIEIPTLARNDQ